MHDESCAECCSRRGSRVASQTEERIPASNGESEGVVVAKVRRSFCGGIVAFLALTGLFLAPQVSRAGGPAPRPGSRAPQIGGSIVVQSRKFGVKVAPYVRSGLVSVTWINGGGIWQGASLARLKPGVTPVRFVAALKSGNEQAVEATAIPFGGLSGPGTVRAIVNLPIGHYAVFDTEQGASHTPMVATRFFSVVSVVGSAPSPPSVVTRVTMVDMKFLMAGNLSAGVRALKIYNAGPSNHMMAIFRLHQGKTMQDVINYLKSNASGPPSGPPPGDPVGSMGTMAPRQTAWLIEPFARGLHVAMCFEFDPKRHLPHVAEGMIKQFTVR